MTKSDLIEDLCAVCDGTGTDKTKAHAPGGEVRPLAKPGAGIAEEAKQVKGVRTRGQAAAGPAPFSSRKRNKNLCDICHS